MVTIRFRPRVHVWRSNGGGNANHPRVNEPSRPISHASPKEIHQPRGIVVSILPFPPLEGIDRVFSVFFVHAVVTQPYQPEILTEYVIRGNSAILKCSIPSYIAEFVTVEAWIREDGEVYIPEDPAVGQQGIGV